MPVKNIMTFRGARQLIRMKKGNQHVSRQFALTAEGDRLAKVLVDYRLKQGWSLW